MAHLKRGRVFKYLTVLKFVGKGPQGHFIYECNCKCGEITIVTKSKLLSGHTKSCGCLVRETTIKANKKRKGQYRKNPTDYAFRVVRGIYRANAKSRKVNFSLSDNKLGKLIDSRCFYCDGGFENCVKIKHQNRTIYYNGVDRLDNSKGYTPKNCVPCCFKCNRAKDTMGYDDFKKWIKTVHLNIVNQEAK